MLKLVFTPTMFPRSMTKAEWKEADRWRRVTQKKLAEHAQSEMDNLVVFGTTLAPAVRSSMIDAMVNPPLLMHSLEIKSRSCYQ